MFHLVDLAWYYYAITAGILIGIGLIRKKWRAAALAAYLFFALAVTVLSRRPYGGNHFQPALLWSWKVPRLREEIIMNVVGFIPVGILGASLWGWKAIPLAAGFSLCIEIIQLLTKTGLFETDDILHNTIGAVIGFGLLWLISFKKTRRV